MLFALLLLTDAAKKIWLCWGPRIWIWIHLLLLHTSCPQMTSSALNRFISGLSKLSFQTHCPVLRVCFSLTVSSFDCTCGIIESFRWPAYAIDWRFKDGRLPLSVIGEFIYGWVAKSKNFGMRFTDRQGQNQLGIERRAFANSDELTIWWPVDGVASRPQSFWFWSSGRIWICLMRDNLQIPSCFPAVKRGLLLAQEVEKKKLTWLELDLR